MNGEFRTSMRRRTTTRFSFRDSTPRATGSGRSIRGVAVALASSPKCSDRIRRTGSCGTTVSFRGDMYREWLAYGSDSKRIAEAFVAGINAFVDLTEKQPALLPPEFEVLGYRPAHWAAPTSCGFAATACGETSPAKSNAPGFCANFPASAADSFTSSSNRRGRHRSGRRRSCAVPAKFSIVYLLAKAPVSYTKPANALVAGARNRKPNRNRQQQLGCWTTAHRYRQAHPCQRPAPRARRTVAALRGATRRTWPRRNRRRGTRAARHLHRSQPTHRVRADDFSDRPGRPVCLRDPTRVPLTSIDIAAVGNP